MSAKRDSQGSAQNATRSNNNNTNTNTNTNNNSKPAKTSATQQDSSKQSDKSSGGLAGSEARRDSQPGVSVNFMSRFRDKDTRVLKNLNSTQFIEVWNNYDKDGKLQ